MATKKSEINLPFFVEKKILVRYWLGTGSVMVRSWFGDLGHGSGFGSAEPKFSGSVVHYYGECKFNYLLFKMDLTETLSCLGGLTVSGSIPMAKHF